MVLGLGSMIPGLKPVSDWVDPRRNALMGFSAGMLSGDPGAAMRYAMQGRGVDQQYALEAQERAQAEQERNATAEWLKANYPQFANLPPAQGFDAAMKMMAQAQSGDGLTPDIRNYLFAQENPGFMDFQTQKGGPAEMSLQPTWMKDPQGNWTIGAQTKDGRVVQLDTPDGMSVVPPADVAGAKAGATVDAKTAAAARAALPSAEQMKTITEKAIAEIRNNPAGMKEWFSQIGGRGMFVLPGSEMGKFVAASSPTNAQAFMQARNMLKGGGQITDYEGRRAEDAMSRMQAALDTGDQQQYLQAVADFEAAVIDGYNKLRAAAGGEYSADSISSPNAPEGNYVYNPATGRLEPQ
jgi:hypothetical protein